MRFCFVILFVLFIHITCSAKVDPVDLRCAQVDSMGSVSLTWTQAIDPLGEFKSYEVFHSTSINGTYTNITTINNIAANTFTAVLGYNHLQNHYFYISVVSGSNSEFTEYSDTLHPIVLNVINSGVNLTLSWNDLFTKSRHNPDYKYRIYRQKNAGAWILIDSTGNLSYQDSVNECFAKFNYYVEMPDGLSCSSTSNVDGDIFQDRFAPNVPVMDTISVVAANAGISWKAVSNIDTKGYIVYRFQSGIWSAVDTVLGRSQTYYHYLSSNADNASERYTIASFDSCGNTSAMAPDHQSILLQVSLNRCLKQNSLSWNPYKGMSPLISNYEVWVSINNQTPVLLTTLNSQTYTFIHQNLMDNSTYCYWVRGITQGHTKSSTSNIECIQVDLPSFPSYCYLRYATVSGSNVELGFFADVTVTSQGYLIQRSDDGSTYSNIGFVPASGGALMFYTDIDPGVDQQSFYYKIAVLDTCGNQSVVSNVGQTVFLSVSSDNHLNNRLSWNKYQQFDANVITYDIYRGMNGVMDPVPIATTGALTNYYVDDVSDELTASGNFSYYVVANEATGNQYGFEDNAASNIAEANQKLKVFFPNAFSPDSYNPIFKPVIIFADPNFYIFKIYNRWGQLVFETNDPNEGWDGRYHGYPQKPDAYMYFFQTKTSDGVLIEKSGTVTLVK